MPVREKRRRSPGSCLPRPFSRPQPPRRPPPKCGAFRLQPQGSPLRKLAAGAKRIRTLGPTRVRRPRQPQVSLLTPRWREINSKLRFPDRSAPVFERASPVPRFSGMTGYPPTRPADLRLAIRKIAYTAIPPPAEGIAVGRRPPQTFSISSICAPSGAATQHTCRPLLTRSSRICAPFFLKFARAPA